MRCPQASAATPGGHVPASAIQACQPIAPVPGAPEPDEAAEGRGEARRDRLAAATGTQPRRQRRAPLVPEFSSFADARLAPEAALALEVGDVLREPVQHCSGAAPAGAKVLFLGQETGGDSGAEASWVPAKFGLPWHPDEFARAAAEAVAPFDQLPELRSHVLETVFFVLTRGPTEVVSFRRLAFRHWARRARALEQDEERLHESMEPGVRRVLRGKRLLLLDEMARAAGYPDCGLAAEAARALRSWECSRGRGLSLPSRSRRRSLSPPSWRAPRRRSARPSSLQGHRPTRRWTRRSSG